MKHISILFCTVLAITMLNSCDLSQTKFDKSYQLIGTWELTKRKTDKGVEDPTPQTSITFYKSGKYVKETFIPHKYEEGYWRYDGNKLLTLSNSGLSNDYYIETLNSSTLVLYLGDTAEGIWTEDTYKKPSVENSSQGDTLGAPAKKR